MESATCASRRHRTTPQMTMTGWPTPSGNYWTEESAESEGGHPACSWSPRAVGAARGDPRNLVLLRQRRAQPQVVAAGVAYRCVADTIGLVDGLLEDLRPGGAQRLEGLVQVVDLDEDRQVALGDDLAHHLAVGRRDVVIHGGQQQVVGVTGSMNGEPAHLWPHRDVVVDFEAEPLGVEGERLIQVSAEHGRVDRKS